MVVHWLRKPGHGLRIKLASNAVGAVTTGVALVISIAKFVEGAWMTVRIAPAVVSLLQHINRYYKKSLVRWHSR